MYVDFTKQVMLWPGLKVLQHWPHDRLAKSVGSFLCIERSLGDKKMDSRLTQKMQPSFLWSSAPLKTNFSEGKQTLTGDRCYDFWNMFAKNWYFILKLFLGKHYYDIGFQVRRHFSTKIGINCAKIGKTKYYNVDPRLSKTLSLGS
jgi:hypothetical protein